jgi:signal transduction histidine kinase
VHNTLSIIGPRASAKDLTIESIADATLPTAVIGDAGRIRQILLNLVSNVVKFPSAGKIVVSTRCIWRDDRQATVEWAVNDTRLGIAQDKIGLLFVNFVQADNSISRRFGARTGNMQTPGRTDGRRNQGGVHPGTRIHFQLPADPAGRGKRDGAGAERPGRRRRLECQD